MSMSLQSVEIIKKLKESIESITGENYTDLTKAVQALKDSSGGGQSEEFIGVKYLEVDETTQLPTVADARSLDKSSIKTNRMTYGLFWNMNGDLNGGLNVALKEIYMPEKPTVLNSTFVKCFSLEIIHGNLEKVTQLASCFDGCTALSNIPYMPNVTYIGGNTFRNCTSLTSINIYKKTTTFASTAFTGCTNLTDIYVPWAEGEVANAPWGAPNENLVIHYNTTYDENHNPIIE